MRVAQIGNFTAPWCTEVHLKRALELNGHEVIEFQENGPAAWSRLRAQWPEFDIVLWTRTWDAFPDLMTTVMGEIKDHRPIVGYHLDRWWGLAREHEIRTQQFFKWCDVICTADGGHDQQWADAGILHWWYPPGVLGEEAAIDTQAQWLDGAPDIVFVGSHNGYHPEWPYRQELVAWLRKTYGRRVSFYPDNTHREYPWRGKTVTSQQVRGVWLNALYQHTPVIVGDSCLAGAPARYWSDRVPETIGRGGLLIHPAVEGGFGDEHLLGGIHGLAYDVGDFDGLAKLIDWAIDDPLGCAPIRAAGRSKVLEQDTYEVRMRTLVEQLAREGLVI